MATNPDIPAGWSAASDIVPFSYNGVSFPGGVAKGAARVFTVILDRLVPHIPGGLHDGWCWGFSDKQISGSARDSFHRFGLAIDINAPVNGRGQSRNHGGFQVLPADTPTIIDGLYAEWGGVWGDTDPMHIEIHGTPEQINGLFSVPDAPVAHTPVTQFPAQSTGRPGSRTIQQGSAGDDVKALQDVLNRWYPKRTALTVDGLFGPRTTDTVKFFQKNAKLADVDGIVGRQTWAGLGFGVNY